MPARVKCVAWSSGAASTARCAQATAASWRPVDWSRLARRRKAAASRGASLTALR